MTQKAGLREAPSTAARPGGRVRILDTAERLFAQEGPAAVTLRSIATCAEVNVASVSYYFGSKEKLFEEMFLRRVEPLNEVRLATLAEYTAAAHGAPALPAVVAAFVEPALRLVGAEDAGARAIIVQYSLGRILALPEVNRMLERYYVRVRTAFVAALSRAAPHLPEHEVVWRYYWMGGAVMVSLAVPPGMVEADGTPRRPCHPPSRMASELVAFIVQGFGERLSQADHGPDDLSG